MIRLSEKAIKAVKRFQTEDPSATDAMLRIRVIAGGCSGMSYQLDFDKQPSGPGDKVFEHDGVKVITDAKSFLYLRGMEIDFKDGLNGTGFIFKNPNAKNACNCGESFSA